MKKNYLAVMLASLIVLTGCSTSAGTGSLIGGTSGAALGAVVGKLVGGSTTSTVVGAAVGTAVGTTTGYLIGKHMDKVKAQAAAQLANATVEEATDSNGLTCVKVTFDNGILFNTGKYDLQTTAKSELSNLASVLKNNTDCAVAVYGYASSDGSDATNLTLSQNRANSVATYLTGTCGVSSSQITDITGFGETNLVYNADGSEIAEASRRVEIYLYASEAMIAAAEAGTL